MEYPACRVGTSNPLQPRHLGQATARFLHQKAQEDEHLAEMSLRNERSEEKMCNIPAESLSLTKARQLHNLHQFLKILPNDGGFWEMESREARLHTAIAEIPFPLLQQFSLDERLIQVEILREKFIIAVLDFLFIPRDSQDEEKTKIDVLEDKIDSQLYSCMI